MPEEIATDAELRAARLRIRLLESTIDLLWGYASQLFPQETEQAMKRIWKCINTD
jgi:hypothetical protein